VRPRPLEDGKRSLRRAIKWEAAEPTERRTCSVEPFSASRVDRRHYVWDRPLVLARVAFSLSRPSSCSGRSGCGRLDRTPYRPT